MLASVTLATRRRSYWLLFIASLLILLAAVALSLPLYGKGFNADAFRDMTTAKPWKGPGFTLEAWQLAPVGALLLSLFSAAVLFSILVSFRKTASEEIYFFAFWAMSCSFETGRILAARFLEAGSPPSTILIVTRLVLAARFSGYGAFFIAGLRSAGFRNERAGRALLGAIGIGIAAAWTIPLDSGLFESGFLARPSYFVERQLIVVALSLVSAANFLVAVENSGEKVFRVVAVGAILLLVGQAILISAWRPEALAAALILMALGARLVVTRLHSLYLWQ